MKYAIKSFMYFWLKDRGIPVTDGWDVLPVYWKFQLAMQNFNAAEKMKFYHLLLTTPFNSKTFAQFADSIGLAAIPALIESGDLSAVERAVRSVKSGKHGNYYEWSTERQACNWICRMHYIPTAMWGYVSAALFANGYDQTQVNTWMIGIINAVCTETPELDY